MPLTDSSKQPFKILLTPVAIQHCNSRTEYRMIEHYFDPSSCGECAYIIRGLIANEWERLDNS